MAKYGFDFSKLRGRIVEKFHTITKFSEVSGISRNSMTSKLKGYVPFKPDEIVAVCELLDIPIEDVGVYFFTPEVQESGTNHGSDS